MIDVDHGNSHTYYNAISAIATSYSEKCKTMRYSNELATRNISWYTKVSPEEQRTDLAPDIETTTPPATAPPRYYRFRQIYCPCQHLLFRDKSTAVWNLGDARWPTSCDATPYQHQNWIQYKIQPLPIKKPCNIPYGIETNFDPIPTSSTTIPITTHSVICVYKPF